jgi:hypothetical protein
MIKWLVGSKKHCITAEDAETQRKAKQEGSFTSFRMTELKQGAAGMRAYKGKGKCARPKGGRYRKDE